MARKNNVGRPPTGIQDRVRLSTFLTPRARALLEAVCHAQHRPAYAVVEEGILHLLDQLDPATRRRVEEAAEVLLRRTRRQTLRRRSQA